jgi:protein TonB
MRELGGSESRQGSQVGGGPGAAAGPGATEPESAPQAPTPQQLAQLSEFRRGVASAVQRHWRLPDVFEGRFPAHATIRIRLSLDASGALLRQELESSSGHPELDAALARAIRAASFPAPPAFAAAAARQGFAFTYPAREPAR